MRASLNLTERGWKGGEDVEEKKKKKKRVEYAARVTVENPSVESKRDVVVEIEQRM